MARSTGPTIVEPTKPHRDRTHWLYSGLAPTCRLPVDRSDGVRLGGAARDGTGMRGTTDVLGLGGIAVGDSAHDEGSA